MWAEMLMCVIFLIAIDLSSQSWRGTGSGIPPGLSDKQPKHGYPQQEPYRGYPQQQSHSSYPQHQPNPGLSSQVWQDNGNRIPRGLSEYRPFFQNLMTSGHNLHNHPQQQPNLRYPQQQSNPRYPQQQSNPDLSSQAWQDNGNGIPLGLPAYAPFSQNLMTSEDEASIHPQELLTEEEVQEKRRVHKAQYDKARNVERARKFDEEKAVSNEFKAKLEAKRLRIEAKKANRLEKNKKFKEDLAKLRASPAQQTPDAQSHHPAGASSYSEEDDPMLQLSLGNNKYN